MQLVLHCVPDAPWRRASLILSQASRQPNVLPCSASRSKYLRAASRTQQAAARVATPTMPVVGTATGTAVASAQAADTTCPRRRPQPRPDLQPRRRRRLRLCRCRRRRLCCSRAAASASTQRRATAKPTPAGSRTRTPQRARAGLREALRRRCRRPHDFCGVGQQAPRAGSRLPTLPHCGTAAASPPFPRAPARPPRAPPRLHRPTPPPRLPPQPPRPRPPPRVPSRTSSAWRCRPRFPAARPSARRSRPANAVPLRRPRWHRLCCIRGLFALKAGVVANNSTIIQTTHAKGNHPPIPSIAPIRT
eukprot:Rhum_TRINITY_DN12831_c0_g1::Rhum_TRINITY_DN12831_c0_g1_i3::g.54879::m.54879